MSSCRCCVGAAGHIRLRGDLCDHWGPGQWIPGPSGDSHQDGQAESIDVSTSDVDLFSPNQAVLSDQNLPEPTAAGIRSEASNRKVADGSVRYLADRASIGSVYR